MEETHRRTACLQRILRLGMLGEKCFFEDESLYDSILVSANLVQGFTAGVASFLLGHTRKPFMIDPMTHAFGHEVAHISRRRDGNLEVKPALSALAAEYGDPFVSQVGHRPLIPSDFTNDSTVDDVCRRVLEYQQNVLGDKGLTDEDAKYVGGEAHLRPAACVAPYFYMQPRTAPRWRPINRALATCFLQMAASREVTPLVMVCVDREMLELGELDLWLPAYVELGAPTYCLWVSDLTETQISPAEVRGLARACRDLSEGGRSVLRIYGGYLSAVLSHFGVTGVSYGPGYGEERAVTPVGGGLPQPKYYLPGLHQRMDAGVVQLMVRRLDPPTPQRFFDAVCGCAVCRKLIAGAPAEAFRQHYMETSTTEVHRRDGVSYEQPYATQRTRENSTRHFLHRRSVEMHEAATRSSQALAADLRRNAAVYENEFGLDATAHLENWADLLDPKSA